MSFLYTFYQCDNRDGRIGFTCTNGLDKHATFTSGFIPNAAMSLSPAAVMFNEKLYCFYQGQKENGELWYSVFDGQNWSDSTQVANVGMSASPAVVVFNNKLYCFHQGYGSNGQLWYSVFDGQNWEQDQQVEHVGMSASPSVAVMNHKLYCFHQGHSNNGQLWFSVFDGQNWVKDRKINGIQVSASPSAVCFENRLYCFYQGGHQNGQLWCASSSDIFDSENGRLSGALTDSPSAVALQNDQGQEQLYCFYQGQKNAKTLWFNRLESNGWSSSQECLAPRDVHLSCSPSAVASPLAPPVQDTKAA